jgi:hypothetical protein
VRRAQAQQNHDLIQKLTDSTGRASPGFLHITDWFAGAAIRGFAPAFPAYFDGQ